MTFKVFNSAIGSMAIADPEHIYIILNNGEELQTAISNIDILPDHVVIDIGDDLERTYYVPYESISYMMY